MVTGWWSDDDPGDFCVCDIGVQACPWHPDHLLTKEQKIQFRKDWDARVERGWKEQK